MTTLAARAHAWLLMVLAGLWRRLNRRTVFIGITGSVGKTTAASCIEAILASRHRVLRQSHNSRLHLARAVLATRRYHDFAIIETGTVAPGAMRKTAWMLKPDVVVFLAVRPVHLEDFVTLAAVQREKAELLKGMTRGGLAVLNGADPLVMGAPRRADTRVTTFGPEAVSDVWASGVSARWPDRMRLTIHAGGERAPVQTSLVGEQWVPSVLAAVTLASALSIPLTESAEALARVRPALSRMEALPLRNGAVVIRDDHTGCAPSFDAALEFLRTARAERRIAVFADMRNPEIADPVARMADVGRRVAAVTEGAVFVGPHAAGALRAALDAGLAPGAARAFLAVPEAAAYLRAELRKGDLVLIKSMITGHVARIYYALEGEIACGLATCHIVGMCDFCPRLGFVPSGSVRLPVGGWREVGPTGWAGGATDVAVQ